MAARHNKPVYVTQSFMPPIEEFAARARDIFASHELTNHGKYERELEQKLAQFLEVPAISLCANGTLALQLAIRLLNLNGKAVITTPFTYVATTSALLWEGCRPIFADIDPQTLCIDPEQVKQKIRENPDVAGILPVHVYGNACDVRTLGKIASRHNLKIMYDAAHAFGASLNGKSVFAYGDAATGSFHATKLFHTVEGGCIVAPPESMRQLRLLGAFGHLGDEHETLGINAKMSELHAAMGLSVLPYAHELIFQRAMHCVSYNSALDFSADLRRPRLHPGLEWNYAYYPIILPDHAALLRVIAALEAENIHPRRYFYPALTKLPYLPGQSCPIAEDMAERILCLPLWAEMAPELPKKIAAIVNEAVVA